MYILDNITHSFYTGQENVYAGKHDTKLLYRRPKHTNSLQGNISELLYRTGSHANSILNNITQNSYYRRT